MDISLIPMLKDNLCYYVKLSGEHDYPGILIDVSQPDKVIEFLKASEIKIVPSHIITTHKHHDHSGGNSDMKKAWPDI